VGALQPWHWLIVIIAFILLFGAKKLPDAARSLGRSMRIFKSELKELQSDSQPSATTPPPAAPTTPVDAERVDTPADSQQQHSDPRPA